MSLRDMPMISVEQKNSFREAALEVEKERDALAAQLKGTDGFATWKDAALDERVRRVAAEKREKVEGES